MEQNNTNYIGVDEAYASMTGNEDYFTLKYARKVDYTLEPLQCPSCKHIGEVIYNQYANFFSCQWCGKTFKGK